MNKTKIEWCDYTWNPVVGCLRGCPYCYAKRIATRFGTSFEPHIIWERFEEKCPKGKIIFANSMSDPEYWDASWARLLMLYSEYYDDNLFIILSKDRKSLRYFEGNKNIRTVWTITNERQMGENYHGYINLEPLQFIPDRGIFSRYAGVIVGLETGNRKGQLIFNKADLYNAIMPNTTHQKEKIFIKDSVLQYLNIFREQDKNKFWNWSAK